MRKLLEVVEYKFWQRVQNLFHTYHMFHNVSDVFTMCAMWHFTDYKAIHIAIIQETTLMNNDVFVSKFVSPLQVNV